MDDGDVVDLRLRSELVRYEDGAAAVIDFDVKDPREDTFDTLKFRHDGEVVTLDTKQSIIAFAHKLESDGNSTTDTVLNSDGDLTFVFDRKNGRVTDALVLDSIAGQSGIRAEQLFQAGVDSPGQGIGESDAVLGYNRATDTDVRVVFNNRSSEASVFLPDVLVIHNFDIKNGNESTSDKVRFLFHNDTVILNTKKEFLEFIGRINSDGDDSTDALWNRDGDLTFVLERDADGSVSQGIVLADVIGGTFTRKDVRKAGGVEANTTRGEDDAIAGFNTMDDAFLF